MRREANRGQGSESLSEEQYLDHAVLVFVLSLNLLHEGREMAELFPSGPENGTLVDLDAWMHMGHLR